MGSVIAILFLVFVSILFVISVYWTTRKGAPWEPSTMDMAHTMLKLAQVGPEDLVYDLGSGDGRIPVIAALKYGASAVGIEIDPLRCLISRLAARFLGVKDRVEFRRADFFQEDLRDATVVTCYLLQDTNDDLYEKFRAELAPGTRVVSNTHTFHLISPVEAKGDAQLFIFNPLE
ncbi:MAG: SAM-dependent methyltransferase [Anaerolineae bacterium]|jgi:SAM-dependent methyltransferase|nr:SAM-dependent methyltransferase [Anaerolineae bacterium]